MTITFYNYAGDNNKIQKTLTGGTTLTGSLRETSNIVNPDILVETASVDDINYAYIPEFQRYYFITEKKAVRENIFRISMHVDVLMSFNFDILNLYAIAGRVTGDNGELFNSYLPDNRLRLNASDYVGHYELHEFGWGNQYILITAG